MLLLIIDVRHVCNEASINWANNGWREVSETTLEWPKQSVSVSVSMSMSPWPNIKFKVLQHANQNVS